MDAPQSSPNVVPASDLTPAMQAMQNQPPIAPGQSPDAVPDSDLTPEMRAMMNPPDDLSKAGSAWKAGAEGVAQGVLGPLAPMIEHGLHISTREEMRQTEAAHPIAKPFGEAVGLIAPMLLTSGVSLGAKAAVQEGTMAAKEAYGTSTLAKLAQHGTVGGLMDTAGHALTSGLGLPTAEEGWETAKYLQRVGSSVVRQAAETAVMEGSDQAAKYAMSDENAPFSAESAISDIGLAGVIGGTAGGVFTGAISPLWKATVGPKFDQWLASSRIHMDKLGQQLKDYAGVTTAKIADPEILRALPNETLRNIARESAARNGRELEEHLPLVVSDPERGAKTAEEFENMPHAPEAPATKKSYAALVKETEQQFQLLEEHGYHIEPLPKGQPNPYKTQADMMADVQNNKHLYYDPTVYSFGPAAKDQLPNRFSLLSAQTGKDVNEASHASMKHDLEAAGLKATEMHGDYVYTGDKVGTKESGFMVEHSTPEQKAAVEAIAKKYNQESVIHSELTNHGRFNEKTFMDGRPGESGYGIQEASKAKENFTEHPQYGKFNLNFGKPIINTADHPLMRPTGRVINGIPLYYNDMFRAVHDIFGHAKEGFSFSANGEENAWLHHMKMYSKEAQPAMTTETRGQNSWVNYGPHGKANRANPANTIFAQQKAGLLPKWVSDTTPKDVRTITKSPINKQGLKDTLLEAKDRLLENQVEQTFESAGDEDSPVNHALRSLGVNVPKVYKAALQGDEQAKRHIGVLLEGQNKETHAALHDLTSQIHDNVVNKLGVNLDDMANYSNNLDGVETKKIFAKELQDHYQPQQEAYERDSAANAGIVAPSADRHGLAAQILESGRKDFGADSPYYDLFTNYAQRVTHEDRGTIGALDQLRTELYNSTKSLSKDQNEKNALHSIRNMIGDFQDRQIEKEGTIIGENGVQSAPELLAQRKATRQGYKDYADMLDQLQDHLGVGNFKGTGALKNKIADISPEDILKKFSPKGNADAIPFLQKNFPKTAAKVQENETKKFLAPAVKTVEGESTFDIKKASDLLARAQKGAPEYANFAVPQAAQEAIQNGRILQDAIPKYKSSGTAGWLSRMLPHPVATAMSTIGYMMGHNPISGYIAGEVGQYVGKKGPEAIRLAHLKYLGSDKPVSAQGYKATHTFLDHSLGGQQKITRAVRAVISGEGASSAYTVPSPADRMRLDKMVAGTDQQNQNNPGPGLDHYMPIHNTALQATANAQLQYLRTLKPQPHQDSPFTQPRPPSAAETARYNKALDIAQDPTTVLKRVQDGSVQMSDINDLRTMYPSTYDQISQQLTQSAQQALQKGDTIPYRTRLGMSVFLGQPIDMSMQPASLQAIQQVYMPQQQQQQGQPQGQGKTKKGTSTLGKSNSLYRTQTQTGEADRGNRD